MEIQFFQADAFTARPFKGNPAAVCLLKEDLSEEDMQAIAAENNLAETAFVKDTGDGFSLRWFTPEVEVDLCGHATLATSHILWQEGWLTENETALFHTRSGILKASKNGKRIELDFPATFNEPAEAPEAVIRALNVKPVNTVFAKDRYLIEVENAGDVVSAKPDFTILKDHKVVVLTSLADQGSGYDFISRTFCPAYGINEDPVTGSSHCILAPYYAGKLNKKLFSAYQASARGGELQLELSGNRVLISGEAVTVIEGVFKL